MKQSLLILMSGLSLLGCASDQSIEQKLELQPLSASVCCEAATAYPWITLNQEQQLKFQINQSSPVDVFPSGKSYFAPFVFDQQSGVVDLLIRSNMEDGLVAIPVVELLDKDFQTVKTLTKADFKIVFSDAFARNRFELEMKVDSVETPYMVIYADNSQLASKVVVPHPAKLRAEESGEPMPIVTDPTYLASNVGYFSIEVETLSLSGFGQKELIEKSEGSTAKLNKAPKVQAISETQNYYHNAIKSAVQAGELDKALSLLEEAKALHVEGAQETFIKSVNAR